MYHLGSPHGSFLRNVRARTLNPNTSLSLSLSPIHPPHPIHIHTVVPHEVGALRALASAGASEHEHSTRQILRRFCVLFVGHNVNRHIWLRNVDDVFSLVRCANRIVST